MAVLEGGLRPAFFMFMDERYAAGAWMRRSGWTVVGMKLCATGAVYQ
jgi:hypothetical protein